MIFTEPRKSSLKPFPCKAFKSQGLTIVLVLD